MSAPGDAPAPPGLQEERTSLAWERTAVAQMVAGTLLARWIAEQAPGPLVLVGLAQVVIGAALLVWAGAHYEDLQRARRGGGSPVHPGATWWVGLATTIGIGAALGLAALLTFTT